METRLFPQIRTPRTTQKIMLDVIIALTPAALGSVYFFGINSLWLILASVAACVLTEALWQIITRQKVTVGDLSAVVTGILLAFNMPADCPLWVVAAGGIFAILVVKQLFGGIGSNFANPALMGRLFIMSVYPSHLMHYTSARPDIVSSPTILGLMKGGAEIPYSYLDMFIGRIPGAIGETSALLLLIGFIYLVAKKVTYPIVPAVYMLVTVAITTAFGFDPLTSLLSGGLILGGFFMITDYPAMSVHSKVAVAVIAAVITALIRIYARLPEGVCMGILAANCMAGIFDKFVKPKIYGMKK